MQLSAECQDYLATAARYQRAQAYDQALNLLHHVLRIVPNHAATLAQLAEIYAVQGELTKAQQHMQQALHENPNATMWRFSLALIAHERGDYEAALNAYRDVLSKLPTHQDCLWNLAILYQENQQYQQQESLLLALISHYPDRLDAQAALARCYLGQNKLDLAKHHYAQCLAVQKNHLVALCGMGNVLRVEGALLEARQYYETATQLEAAPGEAWLNLGICDKHLGRLVTAENALQRALQCSPQLCMAWQQLAECYYLQGYWQSAHQAIEQALLLSSDNLSYQVMAFYIQCYICDWQSYDDNRQAILDRLQLTMTESNMLPCAPLMAMYLTQDLALIRASATHYNPSALSHPMTVHQPDLGHIRLGFISSDFNDHPVGFCLRGFFSHFDKTQFSCILYDTLGKTDAINQELRQQCSQFKDISQLSNQQSATVINHDKIDILVDFSAHTSLSRPDILILQPAPIQCHMLGNVITLAHPAWQYMLSCPGEVISAEQQAYTETIVYLPNCQFAIQATTVPNPCPTRSDFGLPNDGFIMANFTGLHRVSPTLFRQWCYVLQKTSDSYLWLRATDLKQQATILAWAKTWGVARDRIYFNQFDHLSTQWPMACADIALDGDVLSGFTSSLLAVQAGLPVVCLSGGAPYTRQTALIMRACGFDAFICEDYKHLAQCLLDIINNKVSYQSEKCGRQQSAQHSCYFQQASFVSALEQAFQSMIMHAAKKR